jgi:hypothetical protein
MRGYCRFKPKFPFSILVRPLVGQDAIGEHRLGPIAERIALDLALEPNCCKAGGCVGEILLFPRPSVRQALESKPHPSQGHHKPQLGKTRALSAEFWKCPLGKARRRGSSECLKWCILV